MPAEKDDLRDWHRLFGLLLTDFFTDSPYVVEVERDLSQQQQLLDVVIVRRGRGRFTEPLPDGLEGLADHNLITFKSHQESLDDWAMKELLAHYVAYRKFVSPSPSELLPEERFRLYAVAARFPRDLSGRVPWREVGPGVYDCRWGQDDVRVVVAGQLPRAERNAPLHLFSAAPELIGFGQHNYRQRSARTSLLLGQLFEKFRGEGIAMAFTMEDFTRRYIKEHFAQLTPEEQREALERLTPEERREVFRTLPSEERRNLLRSLPPEELLAALSPDQVRDYFAQNAGNQPPVKPRKPRRKK